MKYYLYIIRNSQNKLYIGQTSNLIKRLKRHQQLDGAKFTKDNKKVEKIISKWGKKK